MRHNDRMARKFDPGYSFRSSDFRSQPGKHGQHRAQHTGATPPLARIAPPLRSQPGDDGKRDCARGQWCTSWLPVTEDGATTRAPARTYQPFCPEDRHQIEHDLHQMPAQFVHLAAEIGNPVRNGQMIRVPFGPRILVRLDVDTLMRAVVEALSSWHERIADADNLSYPLTAVSRFQRQMVAVQERRTGPDPPG